MPRSKDAKQWQPDAYGQEMIDRMTNYSLVAERCCEQLRSLDSSVITPLYTKLQAYFQADPVKYPSAMAQPNDPEMMNQFHRKCQALCFPPEPKSPRSPEDYIITFFAANAGMQHTMTELDEHPYGGEIIYRSNLQVMKTLQGQEAYDTAVEDSNNARTHPGDYFDREEKVRCLDEASGEIVEYEVVDIGTSVVDGEYCVLQDAQGNKKQISVYDFYDIHVEDD